MIIDKAIYRHGSRREIDGDISDAFDLERGETEDCFLWIGLHEPTAEEFTLIQEELDLHPLAVEDALEAHERPKIEHYGETSFVVVKTLSYDERAFDVEAGEIMLFVGTDFIVSVQHGPAGPLDGVRERLEKDPDFLRLGPPAVLHGFIDDIVDHYGVIGHKVETDIIALEQEVFRPRGEDVTEEIYRLKREVLEFRRAEGPLIPVLQEIVKGRMTQFSSTREHFRDVLDHLLRVDDLVDAHNELLTSALTAHLALLGKEQNEDVRKISSWAAVIAVPTMIAGFYGMNFDSMPELHWDYGYPLMMAVMVLISVLIYHRLRRNRWL
ncbi:magnesium and cobalt transport protein CorA [Nocardiopsis changdeensis]|uniref:Magnesium and cobalt transport protein CorA n=1 Tax=Nocardiopsis changdeensis TaxID=2831969 RepID=A0ABX8BX94_9ACTN|nr:MULTISPECIES: magnesium and cobalt transport protein CorA [Nocardiopsis]QUX25423.1 magnesium and cobalt transport protein CorA [Nocardiopsis changdeensis]QYX35809.1 magnesium and cobalt transport protein CorA [Nocardiopsis sp. MT53]